MKKAELESLFKRIEEEVGPIITFAALESIREIVLGKKETVAETKLDKFRKWSSVNSPNTLKMKEPLTAAQLEELLTIAGWSELSAVLIAMGNWLPLLKKNVSTYRTALTWLKNKNENGRQTAKSALDQLESDSREALRRVNG